MKECSYCGKRYPDNATVCETDGNPLVNAKFQPASQTPHPSRHPSSFGVTQALSILGFSILSGLCGVGVVSVTMNIVAISRSAKRGDEVDFVADHRFFLWLGGIIGLIVGLTASIRYATSKPAKQTDLEARYVGRGGRLRIYAGAPFFIGLMLVILFGRQLHFGTAGGTYACLGVFLAVLAAGLYLYGRIPAKWIVPVGIIGWLLSLLVGIWFGFFYKPHL